MIYCVRYRYLLSSPNIAATIAIGNHFPPPLLQISELDLVLGLTSAKIIKHSNADPINNIDTRTTLLLYNTWFQCYNTILYTFKWWFSLYWTLYVHTVTYICNTLLSEPLVVEPTFFSFFPFPKWYISKYNAIWIERRSGTRFLTKHFVQHRPTCLMQPTCKVKCWLHGRQCWLQCWKYSLNLLL